MIEFGDFQTPVGLAERVCAVAASRGARPATILEPTCGTGSFLVAALDQFPEATSLIGLDINSAHLEQARQHLAERKPASRVQLRHADFFAFDWSGFLATLPEPILILGNPPWVTAADLGRLGSTNLPPKSNFQSRRGLDALTGKSNFDIAEWIVVHFMEWLRQRRATIALLLKTSVARRALLHAWRSGIRLADARLLTFDAQKHFGAGVDACLFVCRLGCGENTCECDVADLAQPERVVRRLGYEDGALIANRSAFYRWRHLQGNPAAVPAYRWRSGVKHDCAKVMELREVAGGWVNGLGEHVDIEADYVFPLLKGSDLSRPAAPGHARAVILPQFETGHDTRVLSALAPRLWAYLSAHRDLLDRRASSIYRNRPPFSIFGVGKYSFSLCKVAISALHKSLEFVVVEARQGKPTLLDDTCYYIPCQSRQEARLVASMLDTDPAKEFYDSFIFWDAKRPITVEVLGRLDLLAIADELGKGPSVRHLRPDLAHSTAAGPTLF